MISSFWKFSSLGQRSDIFPEIYSYFSQVSEKIPPEIFELTTLVMCIIWQKWLRTTAAQCAMQRITINYTTELFTARQLQ